MDYNLSAILLYQMNKEQRKFTNKEIKQMWDDLRIRAAWYSMVVSGKRVYSTKLKKEMTEEEIVKQFSKLRAILWALGYPLKSPKDKNKKKLKSNSDLVFKSYPSY